MDEKGIAYYFFEHPSPRSGRMIKTRYRMTLAVAKERHGDLYRPILETVEYRSGKPVQGLGSYMVPYVKPDDPV